MISSDACVIALITWQMSTVVSGFLLPCSSAAAAMKSRPRVPCLPMGGYYNEPETTQEQDMATKNSHMVFGVRCIERRIALQSGGVTVLQPVVTQDDEKAWSDWVLQCEVDLTNYMLRVDYDWTNVHVAVMEEGPYRTGLVSLALQQQGAHVTAISSQLDRLQIIQSSRLFYPSATSSSSLKIVHRVDEQPLPPAEILVLLFFPDSHDSDEYREFQLHQWLLHYPCIVYMTATDGQINVLTRS